MRLYALLVLLCAAHAMAQVENSDIGALPQRALPFRRQRVQAPAAPNVVLRNRRPGQLPPAEATLAPQSYTSPLDQTPSAASLPNTPLPPAVVEEIDEEDYDLDDDPIQSQLAPEIPSPRPPPPPPQQPRPQNVQPAVFRPARPAFKPAPLPPAEINPIVRQTNRQRPLAPNPSPSPTLRPLPVEDEEPFVPRGSPRPIFRPSPAPQQVPVRQAQPQQQPSRPNGRGKKPVAQVIHRYREDNPDGSITWGFENDDGTFKEETIGVDCTVHGKYGYYDPDGVRREYAYSSGIPCDKDTQKKQQEGGEGFIDYQNNKYVLPNGDSIDLETVVKNKARRPVQPYRQ